MVGHRLEMKIRSVRFFVIPAAILVFVTAVIPLIVLATSVIDKANFFSVWTHSSVRRALVFSLWQALLSTAFTIFLGVIATWHLSRYQFLGRRTFIALVTVPFVLPTVAVGAAFIAVLPKALHHSTLAIVLAHIFFNISIVVRTVGPRWN